jgi:hypothetical protein
LSVVVGIGIVLVVIIIIIIIVLLCRVSLFSSLIFFFFENVFEVALLYKRGNTQRVVVSLNKQSKRYNYARANKNRNRRKRSESTPHHQLFHVFHVILASFGPTFPRVILVLFAHVRVELEVQRFQHSSTFRLPFANMLS